MRPAGADRRRLGRAGERAGAWSDAMTRLRQRFWFAVMDAMAWVERRARAVYLFAVERASACVDYPDEGESTNPPF